MIWLEGVNPNNWSQINFNCPFTENKKRGSRQTWQHRSEISAPSRPILFIYFISQLIEYLFQPLFYYEIIFA